METTKRTVLKHGQICHILYIRRKIGTVETPFFFKKGFYPSFLDEMHIYTLHSLTGILEDRNMRSHSEEEEEEKDEEEEEEEW